MVNTVGTLTIVEFIDYQCTYCKRAHPEVTALVAADTDIRYVVKELPLLGPASTAAARVAMAVQDVHGAEIYAGFSDAMMRHPERLTEPTILTLLETAGADAPAVLARARSSEVTAQLNATRALANAIGLTGTPTFVMGDRMVRGFLPRAEMEAVVAEAKAGL
ncbi:MAG: DsbA family protein [Pseudomonadota bacterium]